MTRSKRSHAVGVRLSVYEREASRKEGFTLCYRPWRLSLGEDLLTLRYR
ncbi:hypothetical protein [Nostoc sp. ChiSLP03a]|nr:hypothetical protein [Nostoc sp. ChiSLP03a]MDZ8214822.1 hypothetical protein [Nostoc sp. ChiSLP03a]